jgi:6-phosphogluconolactonase
MLIFIGTATGGKSDSRGIYSLRLDPETGKLSPPKLAAATSRPTWVSLHPSKPVLYACAEVGDFEGKKSGGVSAFAINADAGELTLINQQPSGGMGPCYVAPDRAGKVVVAANYVGGSVACLKIDADGKLSPPTSIDQHHGTGPNPQRQTKAFAHSINVDPTEKFAIACDLGNDHVYVYRIDTDAGTLTPNDPPNAMVPPGSGPRHMAMSSDQKFVYISNEMGGTVTAFAWDADRGTLREIQTISTLPADFSGTNTVAEVSLAPGGKFLYAANRGHDSIAGFSVDHSSGKLTAIGHTPSQGKVPRHFAIDPTGNFMLLGNQDSGTLVLFHWDSQSGGFTPTGETAQVPAATCVRFVAPAAK